MRVACLRIPDFAVWAQRRHDPSLRGVPVVVGGIPPERGRVLALSPESRSAGIRLGMTLTQALAAAPQARFLPADDDLVRGEERELLALLHTFTPAVEQAERGHGRFFLDIRGLERHYHDETDLARTVRTAVRHRGYPVAIGIAANKVVAAIAAAEARGGVLAVRDGTEPAFLIPLPLDRLPFPDPLFAEVRALGLATVGDWAALPPSTIGARFGAAGLALHALARGEDPAPLTRQAEPVTHAVEVQLYDPLDDSGLLTFHLKRAVETLCGRLAARGLSATTARLTLELENHERESLEATFARPTLAPRLVLDCLRMALARQTFTARVASFTVTAVATERAPADQLELFAAERTAHDPTAVEQALARIRAMLGPDSVVSPRPADTHRPERQISWVPYDGGGRVADPHAPFGRGRKGRSKRPAKSGRHGRTGAAEPRDGTERLPRVHPQAPLPPGPALAMLPARLLTPPVPAVVRMQRGQPAALAVAGLFVDGRVTAADGPHRIAGEWWGATYGRDYYMVELATGGRYWIFRDHISCGWLLQGFFD